MVIAALILVAVLSLGDASRAKRFLCLSGDVCYNETVDVGCFDRVAFGRFCQHVYLPASPEDVDPKFTVYHSDDRFSHHHLYVVNLTEEVRVTRFPRGNEVTFVIHGFGESTKAWMQYAKDALVRLEAQTVVLVYWGRGSSHPNYFQASANTRVVGRIVARVISAIHAIHSIPLNRFRLVGFSLGAHVAGFVGKEFKETKIGAIYGLDPAGPLFTEGNPNRFYNAVPADERLDRNDADYVEILHTSGDDFLHAGAGTAFQWGDVDFYANGGEQQSGCEIEYLRFFTFSTEDMVNEFWNTMKCSHVAAYHTFIHSVTEDSLERHVAFECPSKQAWTYGRCTGGEKMEFGFKRYLPVVDKASPQRKFFFGTLQNGTRGVHVSVELENTEKVLIPRKWTLEVNNATVPFILQLPAVSEHLVLPAGNQTFVAVIAKKHLEAVDGAQIEGNTTLIRFTAFGLQYPTTTMATTLAADVHENLLENRLLLENGNMKGAARPELFRGVILATVCLLYAAAAAAE